MRRLGFVILSCVTLGLTGAAAAPIDPHTIVVSGYAEMQVKPDQATVNIGVETSDKVTTKALEANSVLMRRVVDAIKSLGIADTAMQTADFSIEAQHPTQKNGYGPDLTVTLGYQVSNTLMITLTDLDKVAPIIDAAVRAGANASNSVRFEAKNRKSYEDRVLAEAVGNARHNAEIMAAAEQAKIGRMISMANTSTEMPLYRVPNMNAAPAYAMESVVIMPGQVSVSAQVVVTYAVE